MTMQPAPDNGIKPLERVINSFNHKTTTHPNRNYPFIKAAQGLLASEKPSGQLKILQVGCGMALKYFGRLNGLGKHRIFKRVETGLRRIPLPEFAYENYETVEIVEIFNSMEFALDVIDINSKALSVVSRTIKRPDFRAFEADITRPSAPVFADMVGAYDAVICFFTVSRTGSAENVKIAQETVFSFVKPGGLFIGDHRHDNPQFTPVPDLKYVLRRAG